MTIERQFARIRNRRTWRDIVGAMWPSVAYASALSSPFVRRFQ